MAAVAITATLLAQFLWTGYHARERLRRQVPALRAELAAMEHQATELRRLGTEPALPPVPSGEALLAALRTGIGSLGGSPVLRLTGSRQASIQGEVAFDRWVEWLARVQTSQRLHVQRCEVRASPTPGWVMVDAELAGD